MSRFNRLLRALQTLVIAVLRVVITPAWTRDFLAYIYTYRPLPYSPRIRRVKLVDIIPGISRIKIELRNCFLQHGNMTGEEIITFCLITRWIAPQSVFEFGTFNGNTTLQMTLNTPEGCEVFTLNLPADHSETKLESSAQDKMVQPNVAGSGQAFKDQPERSRIHELFGDSATFDYLPYHGRCDLVLVDAGHEYDYVKSDTQNAMRLLVAEGGVIVWHDFPNAPGVYAWLEERSREYSIYHIENTRLAFSVIGTQPRCGKLLSAHSA